jgi:large conductance mechanosensitive channel
LHYGSFLQTIINFFVISLSVFVFFKVVASMRQKLFREGEDTPPAQKPAQERLLEEIRDLLKTQQR